MSTSPVPITSTIKSESELIDSISKYIIAINNKNTYLANNLNSDIQNYIKLNKITASKMIDLQKQASLIATNNTKLAKGELTREMIVKKKAKILTNDLDAILTPGSKTKLDADSEKLKMEISSNKNITTDIINEANDRAIISILRKIKVPDNKNITNLQADNNRLLSEINNLNTSASKSKTKKERDAITSDIKIKQNALNINYRLINEYGSTLNAYNNIIAPKIPKINEYITNVFGTYYTGAKKDDLIKRSESNEIIQVESYENVTMIPLNHIGVM